MATLDTKVIMVMGVTGVGKSTFIKALTNRSDILVGHGVASCTEVVTSYPFQHADHKFLLVDTPGFDDTYRSDYDVLEEVTKWLKSSDHSGTKLTGVIYLHRISDTRLQGCSHRNLRMFKRLCGDDFCPNITLGTTFWSTIDESTGRRREEELRDSPGLFHDLIEQGALMVRVGQDRSACLDIITAFITAEPRDMLIQTELISQNKTVAQTSAAMTINPELARVRQAHEQAIAQQRAEAQQQAMHEEQQMREEREQRQLHRERDLEIRQQRTRDMLKVEQQRIEDSDRQRRELLETQMDAIRESEQREAAFHAEEMRSVRQRERYMQQQILQMQGGRPGKTPEVRKVPEMKKIPELRKVPEVNKFRW